MKRRLRLMLFFLILHSMFVIRTNGQAKSKISLDNIQIITIDNAKELMWDRFDEKWTESEKEEFINDLIKSINRLNEFKHTIAIDIELLDNPKSKIEQEFNESMPMIHNYLLSKNEHKQYLFLKIYDSKIGFITTVRVHNRDLTLSENIAAEKALKRDARLFRLTQGKDIDLGTEILNYISRYIWMFFSEDGTEVMLDAPLDSKSVSERYKN